MQGGGGNVPLENFRLTVDLLRGFALITMYVVNWLL